MEVALGCFDDGGNPMEDDSDIDFSQPANDGMEYLRRVQKEAAQCAEVVVATKIDRSTFSKKQTVGVSSSKYKMLPAPASYLPNEKWQMKQSRDFALLRQTFIRFKTQGKKLPSCSSSVEIPDTRSKDDWCKFCFGTSFYNEYKKKTGNPVTEEDMLDTTEGNPPLLSIISAISQPLAVDLLEHHIEWFEKIGLSPEQGRWFYALLICLDKPTPPEAVSLLRCLARKCGILRASLSSRDDPLLPHVNLLITLVARYFGQSDLLE